MAAINDYRNSSDSPDRLKENYGKDGYGQETVNIANGADVNEDNDGHHLHRGLKARQITMIAIGGAIGTGLIIGTGKSLAQAGPAPLVIGYSLVGFLCFLVMAALGEMACWLPMASGFTGYATRFVDPALGFCLGWNYWFKYIIVTPNNLTAASLVIQYWLPREKVNPGVFIAVFLVAVVAINYFGIKFFGEFEFWLSSIKVVVILGLILLSLVLACGGGPNKSATGFTYWGNPGAFKEYILHGAAGRFLAVWSTFTTAVFAYLGTELVGVTVGEAANPRKVIPRAIKLTFYRILLFYVVLVFFLGMLVPYNSKQLIDANTKSNSASASPFVVAINLSGIKVLPGILNAAILIFVFSAANSDLYIASRTLYGLAHEKKAPRIFTYTDKSGCPLAALAASVLFCLLAFLGVNTDSYTVFGYFVNLVTMFGLLTWISLLISHISFVRARRAQGIPDSALAYVAPLGMYGSMGALAFSILIAFFKGFPIFCYKLTTKAPKKPVFDWRTFITTYLGIPLYIIMFIGYKLVMKSERVRPETADLYSGKAKIDAEEAEYIERQAAKRNGRPETKGERLYRHTLGWLF